MADDTARSHVAAGKAKPLGSYPHVRMVGEFAFVSGTSSRRPDNSIAGASIDEAGEKSLDIRIQTAAVLNNISDILAGIGAGLDDVVDVTTFLVSMDDFPGYNETYGTFFGPDGPSRTTVAVYQLPHPDLLIEIKAIACLAQ